MLEILVAPRAILSFVVFKEVFDDCFYFNKEYYQYDANASLIEVEGMPADVKAASILKATRTTKLLHTLTVATIAPIGSVCRSAIEPISPI